MYKLIRRLAALALLAALATVSVIAPAQLTTQMSKPSALRGRTDTGLNRLIIKFRDQATDKSGAFSAASALGHVKALSTDRQLQITGIGNVELSYLKSITLQTHVALATQAMNRSELATLVRQLAQDPRVDYAEIDEKIYPLLTPDDTDFAARQWNLKAPGTDPGGANLTAAWDHLTAGSALVNGAGVVVAVLDTGYRPHGDLAANVIGGHDFVSADSADIFTTANDGNGRDPTALDPGDWVTTARPDCSAMDSSWHGTHVAGVIAGVGNNNNGIIGVAYGAKILPVRVLGVCGGYTSDIAAGMRWAAGLPVSGVTNNLNIAKVINLSLGSTGACSNTFQQAVNAVRGERSVVVVATGNDAAYTIGQPANCNGVIAVTAHTRLGDNANYADIGAGTAISAPGGGYGSAAIAGDGGGIYSTSNTGSTSPASDSYSLKAGTSIAAPHVSGVAALLYQIKPGITPDEVFSRLVKSARPHPAGTFCFGRQACGAGLLDADAAVILTLADSLPTTTASASPANPVSRGATVSLAGIATPGFNGSAITSVAWTQLSGTPAVTITAANTASASFVMPTTIASYVFNFRATDAMGRTSDSWVTVHNNTAPVTAAIPPQTVEVGRNLVFTATATDADGDAFTFSTSGLPSGASLNTTTGVFSWTNAQPAGNYSFLIAATDGAGYYGLAQTVNVTVTGPAASGGGSADWTDLLAVLALALAGLTIRRRASMQH